MNYRKCEASELRIFCRAMKLSDDAAQLLTSFLSTPRVSRMSSEAITIASFLLPSWEVSRVETALGDLVASQLMHAETKLSPVYFDIEEINELYEKIFHHGVETERALDLLSAQERDDVLCVYSTWVILGHFNPRWRPPITKLNTTILNAIRSSLSENHVEDLLLDIDKYTDDSLPDGRDTTAMDLPEVFTAEDDYGNLDWRRGPLVTYFSWDIHNDDEPD